MKLIIVEFKHSTLIKSIIQLNSSGKANIRFPTKMTHMNIKNHMNHRMHFH